MPTPGVLHVSGTYVDNTDPKNPIVNNPIISVTGSAVDNTDPINPVINLPSTQLPYKLASGFIKQNGIDPPSLSFLTNNIGPIGSTYEQVGQFHITSPGLFTINKTQFLIGPPSNSGFLRLSYQGPDWAFLITNDANDTPVDGLIINIPTTFEIRVWY